MRVSVRRVALATLLASCGLIFLVTLQQNSSDLSAMERHLFVDDRPADELRIPDWDDAIQDQDDVKPRDNTRLRRKLEQQAKRQERLQQQQQPLLPLANVPYTSTNPRDLWFPGKDKWNDRIVRQMAYVPTSYTKRSQRPGEVMVIKTILAPGGLGDTPLGRDKFLEQECPVNTCSLSVDIRHSKTADAVLIQNEYDASGLRKQPGQIWILWILESPMNAIDLSWLDDRINWTASYRSDSTIVTPYEKFVPFDNVTELPVKPRRDYARGKTKQVAWFVSNCASNNRRMEYVHQLQRYIPVDIFGACGSLQCPRRNTQLCNKMLNEDYKFYLSFENSNCDYYVTEKLFWNALFNDIVPVVMGARTKDYLAAAPPHSFIHVEDFPSAKALADYLWQLDQDDDLYNEYFRWKGTGQFVNTKYWCRLCALLNDDHKPVTWYSDVESWWRYNGTCTKNRWDEPKDHINDWRSIILGF